MVYLKRGEENPFGLYVSESPAAPVLSVNGPPVEIRLDKGYALLDRVWNPADRIVLELPVAPRLVRAHKAARELDGMAAIADDYDLFSDGPKSDFRTGRHLFPSEQ